MSGGKAIVKNNYNSDIRVVTRQALQLLLESPECKVALEIRSRAY